MAYYGDGMNDKLRELAEQADKWAGTEFHRLFLNNINANMKELFEEKFAELIIRECASQVRFTDLLKCNDDSDGEILLQASAQLKQHFGVEE
jgi:hypothetical protein